MNGTFKSGPVQLTWSSVVVISVLLTSSFPLAVNDTKEVVNVNNSKSYLKSHIFIVPSSLPVTNHFPSK